MALSMIPKNVMDESRGKAQEIIRQGKPVNRTVAIVIISIWIFLAALVIVFIVRVFKNGN